jgi:anaerobic selenocysteine-containing dehydrogenase
MLRPSAVNVLWIVGANPLDRCRFEKRDALLVVQDLFLTRTTAEADLVLPAASAYEKSGTMTKVCGEVQRLRRALRRPGTKTDADIGGLIARAMGVPFGQPMWTVYSRRFGRRFPATPFGERQLSRVGLARQNPPAISVSSSGTPNRSNRATIRSSLPARSAGTARHSRR